MRDREREREAETQEEGDGPCREPDVGLDPGSPRPGLKAALKLLSHPNCPL